MIPVLRARRRFIFLWLAVCVPCFAPAAEKRPNILFIIADDQSPFDLKVYDPHARARTPCLDRLAAEGMVFDGAYIMGSFSGAVCSPSRHMIMSGRTVWRLPTAPGAMQAGRCPPDLAENTLPAVFQRAGYATMRTCKVGNSYPAANRLFQVSREATMRGGDDASGSAWHAEQVLDYLAAREAAKDSRPWLIYLGFSHPHDPRDGKPELLAKYGATNHADEHSLPAADPRQPPLPRNYLPAHPFPHGHDDVRDEVAVSGVWRRRDEATLRNELGRHCACNENIDVQIGRVLDKLRAMGELENTYIFYTADNGIALGRHGLMGKQNLYQHSWRVPLIVKGPGIRPGSRAEGNVYLLDVLATLCDLAGIRPPETNEGVSFRPVLEGRQAAIREVVYGVYNGGTKPGIRAVKHGDWKLVAYDVHGGRVRRLQLFHLADNPYELLAEHRDPAVVALTGNRPAKHQVNLADDPAHAAKLKEMQDLLLAEMRRWQDPWRLWNQPADGLAPPAKPGRR